MVLCSLENLAHRLQETQLQRNRLLPAHHRRGLHHFFRGLKFALGVDDFARRWRSASACFAIARFMVSGNATSFTSTAVTLMPHGSVCRSMISCNFWLIDPRCESRSSNGAWPSTLLSVVWVYE